MRDLLEKIDTILTEAWWDDNWEEDLQDLVKRTTNLSPENLRNVEKEVTNIDSFGVNDANMIGNFYGLLADKYGLPMMFHADGSGRATLAKKDPNFPRLYQVIANGGGETNAKEVALKQRKLGALPKEIEKELELEPLPKNGAIDPEGYPSRRSDAKNPHPDYRDKIVTAPTKVKKTWKAQELKDLVATDENLGSLLTQYKEILDKYRNNRNGFESTQYSIQYVGKQKINEAGTAKEDLEIITGIKDAIKRGIDQKTLVNNEKNKHVNNILNNYQKHYEMIQKVSSTTATDLALGQQQRTPPDDGATTLAANRQDSTPPDDSATTLAANRQDSTPPDDSATTLAANRQDSTPPERKQEPERTGIKGEIESADTPFMLARTIKTAIEKYSVEKQQEIMNFLNNGFNFPRPASQPGKLPAEVNPQVRDALNRSGDHTREVPTRDLTQPERPSVSSRGAAAMARQVSSKDFNDLLRLAGTKPLVETKKPLTEASMNISMTGNNSNEVRELMDILKNAGLDNASPVKDLDMFKTSLEPEPCPSCSGMDSDSPCGEAVEEEWNNSPDEEYQDDDFMIHDLSGGINRKKERAAQRVKDPAVAYESNLKNHLRGTLKEMYQQLAEKDPYAELDRAIASDDTEGDLERQERKMRKKFPKRNRSNADTAFDELGQYMKKNIKNESNPNADAAFAELDSEVDQMEKEEIKNLLFQAFPKTKGFSVEQLDSALKKIEGIAARNGQTVKGMLQTRINNNAQQAPQQQAPQQQAPQQQAPGIKGATQQSRPGSSYKKEITPQGSTERYSANIGQMSPQDESIFNQMAKQEIAKLELKNGRWTYPGAKQTWNKTMKLSAEAYARAMAAKKFAQQQNSRQ